MTKNAPAVPDATLTLQRVADASNEVGQTCPRRKAPSSMTFLDWSLAFRGCNLRDADRGG
jgi:hypothetical protein